MKRLVAVGVTALIIGGILIVFLRERNKSAVAKERQVIAAEIVRVAQSAKPLLAKPSGEPDHVRGLVLPIELHMSDPSVAYGGTVLARAVFDALAPELRTESPTAAGTIVFIDVESSFYAGGGAIAAGATGATLTFYEGEKAIARTTIPFPRKAAAEATAQQLADDRDRMAQLVAAYVNGLPRR